MTILVAGKREGLGKQLVPLLMKKGYALLFAATCEQLLMVVRTEPVDLIVMDLELPAEAGPGALQELEPELESISIPVLVVGRRGYVRPSVRELTGFLRRNAAAILDKPVDFVEVEREVARLCGGEVQQGCCLTESTLTQLADGELVEEEASRARRHVSQCRSCQQLFDECRRTDSLLRDFFRKAMTLRMAASDECLSRETLAAYCKEGLAPREREEIEAHLAGCVYCTRELVAFHNLMTEYGQEQLEPLSEDVLNRLKQRVTELLRKAGSVICIRCFESIPLGNAACPQCGAVIQSEARGDSVAGQVEAGASEERDDRDEERKKARPKGSRDMRKGQIAVSLLALSLIASAALVGLTVYRNRPDRVSPGTTFVMRLADSVEEEIEVFGQVAMFEDERPNFRIPQNVDRIARALIERYYYDGSIAEQAFRNENIWDVFETLNRLETRGSRSPLLPKSPNRILTPDGVRVLRDELTGEYKGIGAAFERAAEGSEIVAVVKGSPAEEAGLQVGDVILEIDGVSVRGLSLIEVVSLGRGPAGSRAKLKVARDGVPDFEVALRRQRGDVPGSEVSYEIVEEGVAYVRIYRLMGGIAESFEDTLNELESNQIRRLILDLRGQGGGSVETAADVAALLLPEGTLVARADGRDRQRRFYAEGEPIWHGRLAVLVDGGTMSGGELIAAALQRAERGVVIGEKSAGKGSVQTVYRLTNDYAVQVTTDMLRDPEGFVFNNLGIKPDIELVGAGSPGSGLGFRDESEDIAVKAALESLRHASTERERRVRIQ
jgi:C-terminal peptidase prc